MTEVDQLPDEDLQIGVLLALLQDDAKNQSSYLTWGEGAPQAEVASVLRSEFLVSEERADKLSGAWGRHPLLGRMYLPAYRAGTEKVAELRRKYAASRTAAGAVWMLGAGGYRNGRAGAGESMLVKFWRHRTIPRGADALVRERPPGRSAAQQPPRPRPKPAPIGAPK